MRVAIPAAVLMSLVLSGCAAALVYDRDRPAGKCRDQSQDCLHAGQPAGLTGRTDPVTISGCPAKSDKTET
jgi:hypothetical protein